MKLLSQTHPSAINCKVVKAHRRRLKNFGLQRLRVEDPKELNAEEKILNPEPSVPVLGGVLICVYFHLEHVAVFITQRLNKLLVGLTPSTSSIGHNCHSDKTYRKYITPAA